LGGDENRGVARTRVPNLSFRIEVPCSQRRTYPIKIEGNKLTDRIHREKKGIPEDKMQRLEKEIKMKGGKEKELRKLSSPLALSINHHHT
jgi:hypothetical protein